MAYTVKKLATLSGVSVRTLHFYDEIGLLAPEFVGDNGYRYYEEEQLLLLQQILFYRELGFELKRIQFILSQPDFDKVKALISHRDALVKKAHRFQDLIHTVDQTIKRLKGEITMKTQEIFRGFSKEEQTEHENYLINLYGDSAKQHIDISRQKVKNWQEGDWQKSFAEWESICEDLKNLLDSKHSISSDEVQAVVKRHYKWLTNFGRPKEDHIKPSHHSIWIYRGKRLSSNTTINTRD